MCGIIGFITDRREDGIPPLQLEKMRDTMAHRGPDGSGLWYNPTQTVGFGHRRLSIVDLSTAASQPMVNDTGQIALVFNGEIYNHADIRRELISLGVTNWKTDHSDTEVILRSYEHWGLKCLERFRGMFAIGIWDARISELFLIRDRRGVKPLYWTQQGRRTVFASEIKAIIADPRQRREVDTEAMYHYLSFLVSPAPQTLFRGIWKVPPGGIIKVNSRGVATQGLWYNLLEHIRPVTDSRDEIAARLRAELRTAVHLRKVSDVPVGVFLSGGIDSSTNAALFSEGESARVKTFSIGYKGSETYQNETELAKTFARQIGAEHHELLLGVEDLADFTPQMIHLQDEPLGDPVCVPVYWVSKLARDNGVVVAQVGEGSDELYAGYESWHTFLKLSRIGSLPGARNVASVLGSALKSSGKSAGYHYELLRRCGAKEPVFWSGANGFFEAEKQAMLGDRVKELRHFSSWRAIEPMWNAYRTSNLEQTDLNWMSYSDLTLRIPELLLMRVDKMGMGASIEGRTPFLDHKLVEYSMGIPTSQKLADGTPKSILKKAVRGLIPDEIIDRKKQGFGVPVHEWIQTHLGARVNESIARFANETGYLNIKNTQEILNLKRSGAQAWYLYNLAEWWKTFIA